MKKLLMQFDENIKYIRKYYEYLTALTKKGTFIGPANEWIVDNFYLVIEHSDNIKKIKKNKSLIKKFRNDEVVYGMVLSVFKKYNFKVDHKILTDEINKYQKENNYFLTYNQIDTIPFYISIVIIEELTKLVERENEKLISINEVNEIAEKITNNYYKNEYAIMDLNEYITINENITNNPVYIYHLNEKLKELGNIANDIFLQLNNILERKKLNLKDIIKIEQNNSVEENILAANIFNSLKKLTNLDKNFLYEKVSNTERLLNLDYIYNKMTDETKQLYRNQILKKAKKIPENKYTKILVNKAVLTNKHIGFELFKEKNTKLRSFLYLTTILILTCFITSVLSNYFLDSFILSFILLLIPVSEIVIQITNEVLVNFNKPKPLPKMDFSKGLPSSEATMVVIPTIIKDLKKLDNMFMTLETFYLANKSDNIYFALLADACELDKEIYDLDENIKDRGLKLSNKLNQKYGKEIFHFIYRKRIFSESEQKYLGYERKRGGLVHLNKLLIKILNKDEIDKYFQIETVSKIKQKIKYVITLDTDTKLVLNTGLNLVGAMAHPLNKPILNKEKTKVIKGYGVMQPRISVDIDSTNKSIYSQLFAGIGGFDIYNSVVSNFYQDIFSEGSYIGKGIYDIKVFDEILSDKIPENLVLSHDLLEGNYLRCGFVSDIELIDDFPSKFLVDSTRHSRWARGDVQISGWLKRYINNNGIRQKNPISILGKWKIFDNIRRIFINPALLIIIFSYFLCKNSPIWWMLFVALVIMLPIFFYLKERFYLQKDKELKFKYYSHMMFGEKALLLRTIITFVNIPYYTYLYLEATFKSLYRMFISKRNLLNWITAEDAEKNTRSSLFEYIKSFTINYIVIILLFFINFITGNNHLLLTSIVSIGFMIAPFILWLVSRDIKNYERKLNKKDLEELKSLSISTWKYFDDLLKEETNYLIPDNYQLNRSIKEDDKTSPTDIGMSLTSIISANEIGIISDKKALFLIEQIITTLEKLDKWNGHLYNWYNIKTLEVMYPKDVSSVDSGNLVAALIVVKEYVKDKNNELAKRVLKLINEANFQKLYTPDNVFSVSYIGSENKLSVYNYNKFASESRILSYVAISKGDVPSKHWLCLDKTLTKYKMHKGLVSWSGTAFEYFMPLIFMKNYPNTLLDESYFFSYYCQKSFMNEVDSKLPWGISESAYSEFDNSINYKYCAFGIPYLKIQEDINKRIVISPYSSILTIMKFPNEVCDNLKKFKKLDMFGDYGLYEAYDNEVKKRVLVYYAHHQGMILSSLANYLKSGVIQNYFHSDINVRSFEILLKEKVQIKPMINLKMAKYKRYNYEKEPVENDIRAYDHISDVPEVSVLSNSKYSIVINDRGNGFSRYETIQLNRYRKVSEQDYGIYLYIKDMDTGKIWSNTYAPTNIKPDKYDVVFATDRVKFIRQDEDITTTTEIIVTKKHNAEIRKYTFVNKGNKVKNLELTSYLEAIIEPNPDDIGHRAFKNLFVSSKYDIETNSLIMCRHNNIEDKSYLVNRLIVDKQKSTFETERANFVGRNRTVENPIILNNKLSNEDGTNIDPVMSLRNTITVKPDKKVVVYFISGYGKSREQIMDIINSYNSKHKIESAFEYATLSNNVNTKLLGLHGYEMRNYNIMLNYLYQTSKVFMNEERRNFLRSNAMNQTNLWRFGISGDRPIILVEINDVSSFSIVKELLKAYRYFKSKSMFMDLVIINSEDEQYSKTVKNLIDNEIYQTNMTFDFNGPGNIYVLENNNLDIKEKILLNMVARMRFNTKDNTSLGEAISEIQRNNKIALPEKNAIAGSVDIKYGQNLKFFNGYGGFASDGREYIITNNNTPTPWSNVIANNSFGTIVTNNSCGFTYAYNSQMFKVTSWTNDIVVDDKSEGIKINNKQINPTLTKHGFGYTIFKHQSNEYADEITEFVALNDNVKLYKIKIQNITNHTLNLDINYWLNPTFGPDEEKTSRYILTEYIKNYVQMRNVYSTNFSHIITFMASTLPIVSYSIDEIIKKSIDVNITLSPKEEKEFGFILGTGIGIENIDLLVKKYSTIENINKELENVKNYWNKKLNTIQVKTPDESFNFMINGWYLYQTLSSRLKAKAGFYQVGGAFGFRDQLQDATNICIVNPSLTRKQILINASHQFIEGDVLHWWHTINNFGLRSRYKDDFLWLFYAVDRYIDITEDYGILVEKVPFVTGDKLQDYEEEKGINFGYTEEEYTVYEHCKRAIDFAINSLGENDLPLMGGGDWNDGMNKIGIKGKGTSVWLGFFLYDLLGKFIKLNLKLQRNNDKYLEALKRVHRGLDRCYENGYYLRAFFDNGNKLGSIDNDECKIDLISQSFSIISNIALEKADSVIHNVEENLVDKNLKIIKLLTPGFNNPKDNPGYIANYPVGIRENGGQYTHSVSWYILALLKEGYYGKAFEYYQMINPINRTLTKKDVDIYKVEPYVIAADIYSNEKHPARGGWTWYTGSSGWFYRVGIIDILGFKKHGNKLIINPKVPWDNFEMKYRYKNTTYNIIFEKSELHETYIDGIKVKDIVLKDDGLTHNIIVKKGVLNDKI